MLEDINQSEVRQTQGDGHPIPSELVERIDMITQNRDGKTILSIIASGYLDDSPYTEQRILDKINNYLGAINCEEFKEDFGQPSVEKTGILLRCTLPPHLSVCELIESIREQVTAYNTSIQIEISQ